MPIEMNESALLGHSDPQSRKAAGWPEYPVYYRIGDRGGHDPCDSAPSGARQPHCIYFYYFRIDRDGKLRVTHYFFDNGRDPISNLENCIRSLAQYARDNSWDTANGPQPILQKNANFSGIVIERISYFVVFVDEEHWDFLKNNNNPVVPFHRYKGKESHDPNYSFFNAAIHDIKMPKNNPVGTRQALSMLNLLRREDGQELGTGMGGKTETQSFAFDLILRVTFANADAYDQNGNPIPTTETSRLTVVFDPGGTNLGPPKDP